MDWPTVRRNSVKQCARASFVSGVIFKKLAAGQRLKDIIQEKIFCDHFLMSVNCDPNLAAANLSGDARLDFGFRGFCHGLCVT